MHTFLLSVKHTSESFEYVNLLKYSSCPHAKTSGGLQTPHGG